MFNSQLIISVGYVTNIDETKGVVKEQDSKILKKILIRTPQESIEKYIYTFISL